jgi:hypothetical protein
MERKFNYSLCGVVVAAMVSCLAFVACDGIADITTCTTDADCTETHPECLLYDDEAVDAAADEANTADSGVSIDVDKAKETANIADGEGVCICQIAEDGTDTCGEGSSCTEAGLCKSDGTDDDCTEDTDCGAGYYCMDDDDDAAGDDDDDAGDDDDDDAGDDDDDDAGDDDDDDAGDEEEHDHGHCMARPTDCNDEHAADCEDGQVCGTDGVCSDLGCTDDSVSCDEGQVCDERATTGTDAATNAAYDTCVKGCKLGDDDDDGCLSEYKLCLVDDNTDENWNDCAPADDVTNTGCTAASVFDTTSREDDAPVIYDVTYTEEVGGSDACGETQTAWKIYFKYVDPDGDAVFSENVGDVGFIDLARDGLSSSFDCSTAATVDDGSDGSAGGASCIKCLSSTNTDTHIAVQIVDGNGSTGNASNIVCAAREVAETE